jgi:hypothetical protein
MSGEQLTPREAALWNRTRRETLRDLEVDFRRYMKMAEDLGAEDLEDLGQLTPREKALWDRTAATWAHDIVAGALVRLGRIAGTAEELPPAPCSIGGFYWPQQIPLLCGYGAGHPGQHSWAAVPLPVVCPVPWWRRLGRR